jgi:hypothetical protein
MKKTLKKCYFKNMNGRIQTFLIPDVFFWKK